MLQCYRKTFLVAGFGLVGSMWRWNMVTKHKQPQVFLPPRAQALPEAVSVVCGFVWVLLGCASGAGRHRGQLASKQTLQNGTGRHLATWSACLLTPAPSVVTPSCSDTHTRWFSAGSRRRSSVRPCAQSGARRCPSLLWRASTLAPSWVWACGGACRGRTGPTQQQQGRWLAASLAREVR